MPTKKLPNYSITQKNRGAAALLTIVIIGAASLIMAISAAQLGLGELEMGYTEGKGSAVLSFADGCGEEALARLRKNSAYTGETLTVGDRSCIITVTGGGAERTVASVATIGSYTKKIQMQITLNNSVITINNWSEVSP
ncbi:MAG: hypothetical protein V1716_01645 [Candidatus Uhrbacteria bacterium]